MCLQVSDGVDEWEKYEGGQKGGTDYERWRLEGWGVRERGGGGGEGGGEGEEEGAGLEFLYLADSLHFFDEISVLFHNQNCRGLSNTHTS